MGSFLFSLAIMNIIKSLKSELNIWYLDDGTIAGDTLTVLDDYKKIISAANSHGLEVNPTKCELHIINPHSLNASAVLDIFNQITKGVKLVKNEDLTLLGAPIYPEGIPNVLNPKLENLKLMVTRLNKIDPHQALFLLRNCFSMPKLTYFLRTAPCFLEQGILKNYDEIMRMSTGQNLEYTNV